MAITFPTTLDTLTNPTSTDTMVAVSHSSQHANLNDAVEALEAKIGVDSSAVTSSLDYKLKSTSSISPGHKHNATDIADGSVSNAEFQYLDGVTSSIQSQLNSKGIGDVAGPASAIDSNFVVFDTTTGKLIKDSTKNSSSFAPALGVDDNYVTDAEKVVIGNTSGTNSGNQSFSSTADATSITTTLSELGGSIKLVEGTNISFTPSGTGSNAILTINSTSSGGGGKETLQDYSGPAIIGILGQFEAATTGTLTEVTIIADTLPVGSNLIGELRKNSTTSGNVLSTTLQVTTTESATNGRYIGATPVTTFSSSAIADGDVFYVYLTGVGSTTPALNPRVILRYS